MYVLCTQVFKSLEAGQWIAEDGFEMDSFFPACKVMSNM